MMGGKCQLPTEHTTLHYTVSESGHETCTYAVPTLEDFGVLCILSWEFVLNCQNIKQFLFVQNNLVARKKKEVQCFHWFF